MGYPFRKQADGCLSLSEIKAEFNWVAAVNKNGLDPILIPSQTQNTCLLQYSNEIV
jgi:hypothetical protein